MLAASLAGGAFACTPDDPFDFGGPRSCEVADQNEWVLSLMQQAYLWNEEMPELERWVLHRLAELLSTPLLLTIAARACAGRRDLAISGLGPVAVRRVIYDAYVVQMLLRSTTPSTPLTPILRWLHWLARYLSRNQSSLFLSERLQPTALRAQQRYKRIVGLVVGLVIALIGGPGVGLIIGLKFGPDAGLGIGCRRSWPNAAIR